MNLLMIAAAALLVNGTVPKAEIVIPAEADPGEVYAATDFQHWIAEISGGTLPILRGESDAKNVKIFVGREFGKKFPKDLEAIGRTDGFAVRSEENGQRIYVFGNCIRGVHNGLCRLIERNTDLIWARPEPGVGTIFTPQRFLRFKDLSFLDVPKSEIRIAGGYACAPIFDNPWHARNFEARSGGSPADPQYAPDFRRAGGGHSLLNYLPAKEHFEKHPEWYPLIDGKRTCKSNEAQLCFMRCDEYLPIYVKNLRDELDKKPDANQMNVSIEDNFGVCECELCKKPLTLPDGSILSNEDPAFRSTQFYLFYNKLATELAKTHPQVELITYAYFFTETPPKVKLAPNVCVYFCPYARDYKVPICDPERNAYAYDYLEQWGKLTDKLQLREYYGDFLGFPRPVEYVVQKDIQYCIEHNIRRFSSETGPDVDGGKPHRCRYVWDVSGMFYWVLARIWWNPYQDVTALRDEYMKRTFREAAPAVKKFYDRVREIYEASPLAENYDTEELAQVKFYYVDSGAENELRSYLEEAEKLVVDYRSRELLRRLRARFEAQVAEVKGIVQPKIDVPSVAEAPDLDSTAWDKAADTGLFSVRRRMIPGIGSQPPDPGLKRYETNAKALHDGKNLYLKFVCRSDDMATLKGIEPSGDGREVYPRGDTLELYIQNLDTGISYQFGCDVGDKVTYDVKIFDIRWTCGWTHRARRFDDRWESLLTFPLADLGLKPDSRFCAYLGRTKCFKDGDGKDARQMSVWGGGDIRAPATYGILNLAK